MTGVELGERASVPVRCSCGWDDGGTLELVDRWKSDWPPIPYVRMIELHGSSDNDGRPQHECGGCGEELSEETVEERATTEWRAVTVYRPAGGPIEQSCATEAEAREWAAAERAEYPHAEVRVERRTVTPWERVDG